MIIKFKNLLSWMKNYTTTKALDDYDSVSMFTIGEGALFYNQLVNIIGEANIPSKIVQNTDLTDYAKEIIDKVVQRYGEEVILERFIPVDSFYQNILDHSLINRLDVFLNILLNTYDRYSTLLSLYVAQKDNLMKGLKTEITANGNETNTGSGSSSTTSKTRVNDTPQDQVVEGETYEDEEHTSMFTRGESSGSSSSSLQTYKNDSKTEYKDKDSVIGKLDEIDRLYQDLLLKWSNEFRRFFIGRINYER